MNHAEKQKLYIIAEEQFSNTTWYTRIMEGIYGESAKRPINVILCSRKELGSLPSGTILVLLGSSLPFITEYINLCVLQGLRPIVAGFEIFQSHLQVSYITINRKQAMYEIVKALISCGAEHIALLGVNSSVQTDMLRFEGWAEAVTAYQAGNPDCDVYYSDAGLSVCMKNFWNHYTEYDAVACANDYYAAQLCAQAKERSICIPQELMVTGFGNTRISHFTNPALTTVALNLSSVGSQVFQLYRSLSKNPDLLSCNAMLQSKILFRGSTKPASKPLPNEAMIIKEVVSAFEPTFEQHLRPVYALEHAITSMDEIDRKIIDGLLQKVSYEALAEKLFLSDTAFKYRLYKLFSATECKSRGQLVDLFQTYIPLFRSDTWLSAAEDQFSK